MSLNKTFDILDLYRTKFSTKKTAFAGKEKGQWVHYSAADYVKFSDQLSLGLIKAGLAKGEKVVTISNNRPEWNFTDMALSQTGAVHVPLFANLEVADYITLVNDCEAKYIFTGDPKLGIELEQHLAEMPSVKQVFTFDITDKTTHWKNLLIENNDSAAQLQANLEQRKKDISPDECVTLIYTSGTTGNAKGVLLSHRNLLSAANSAASVFKMTPEQRYLSILPICHVGERMGCYQSQISGCDIYYGENLATIAADLLDVKPQGFGAVPRILEKVYDKIMAKGEKLTGIKKKIFFWSIKLGLEFAPGNEKSFGYRLKLKVADKLVFSKWRAALGGNVESIGVGGAALPPHIERVFWAAGIKLLNMYGLTETAPIITINRASAPLLKLGTVGAAAKGVEVKIASDGEILCKGPNVMLGYFKNETATKEAIVDGWFHTGDIGTIDEQGFLRITDRKKEIFKLSNGKYVSPQAVENKFREWVYIDQIMVIGESEKFASALISPNMEALNNWCKEYGIAGSALEKIENPIVKKFFHDQVNEFNKSLSDDEKIKRVKLVPDEWTPASGELSPTLKLKRKIIAQKYAVLIEEIYLK
ncbi:MAG: long-chain fatty acid--CoA ligase [Crocinitomicaceae bacterium]|nr:long-chain fatty acid--CoA ligase [Crocinitomicaceae bacterium]